MRADVFHIEVWKCGSGEVKHDRGEVVAAVEKRLHVCRKQSES
jgi:hypothetical protein